MLNTISGILIRESKYATSLTPVFEVRPWKERWWKPWDSVKYVYINKPICYKCKIQTLFGGVQDILIAHPDIVKELKEKSLLDELKGSGCNV